MNKNIIDLINRHEDLIDENKFDILYRKCDYMYRSELTEIFHSCNIYPEYYLTEIPYHFLANSNESEIIIPNNIENIDDQAYWFANNVTRIFFDNSRIADFQHIHNRFQGVAHNTTECIFEVGPNCTYIPNKLCVNGHRGQYPRITKIDLTNSHCTRIGKRAFDNLQALTDISFNPELTIIEDGAFASCDSISKLTIPSTIQSIGSEAFLSCYGLRELSLSKNTTLGKDCFAYGSEKEELTIFFDGTRSEFKQRSVKVFTHTYYTCHCTDGKVIKKR
jgi:hypothetical protein